MLHILKLLLPALIPSWRFFDTIAPSPRIEFTVFQTAQETASDWQEFCPRPARLSFGSMLMRMIWNPRWNESLFLVSCAERLTMVPGERSIREIEKRIARHCTDAPYLQFRLAFVSRDGNEVRKHITYVSQIYSRNADS